MLVGIGGAVSVAGNAVEDGAIVEVDDAVAVDRGVTVGATLGLDVVVGWGRAVAVLTGGATIVA